MSSPPQSRAAWRVPRAHLEGSNPTVLRFSNGRSVAANLQVISQTGGLLSVSQPMVQGSEVKMIFLTEPGQCWEARKCFSPSTTVCNLFGLFRWRRTINGDWENWSRNVD